MSDQRAVMNISKRIGTGSASWRRKPPPFTVLAGAGLFAVLALSSCAEAAPVPDNAAAASPTQAAGNSAPSAGRPAPEVFAGFMAMASAAVDATNTGGWVHADGSPWDPTAPDLVFYPHRCPEAKGGRNARDLQLALEGPAPVDPRAARDEMRDYLKASGFTLTSMIDPSDGTESDMPYSVGARGPKDELIVYSASRVLAGFTFESECSDHPSLEREVSAATR